MATYTITIIKHDRVECVEGKEWSVLSTDEHGRHEMGYTPEIRKVVDVDEQLYQQTVESINLVAIIAAVNQVETVRLSDREMTHGEAQ